jgi:hypothetical protein
VLSTRIPRGTVLALALGMSLILGGPPAVSRADSLPVTYLRFPDNTKVSGTIVLAGTGVDTMPCPQGITAEDGSTSVSLPFTCADSRYRLQWNTTPWTGNTNRSVTVKVTWSSTVTENIPLQVVNQRSAGRRVLAQGVFVTGGWPTDAGPAPFTAYDYARTVSGAAKPWVGGYATIVRWKSVQPTMSGGLDLGPLRALVNGARTDGRTLLMIFKIGGNSTPDWVFNPPFSVKKLRYVLEDGLPQAGDRTVDDLWTNVAAQLAAEFDDDAGFAGILQAGAASQYPEMWYSLPESCLLNCTSADSPETALWAQYSPGDHANAWVDLAGRLKSQFRRAVFGNMLDYTYQQGTSYTPGSSAMDQILASSAFTALPSDGYAIGTVNLALNGLEDATRAGKYAKIFKYPPAAPRLYEADPAKLIYPQPPPPRPQWTPAAGDLKTVVNYCDSDDDSADAVGERPGKPVACRALVIHRQQLDPTYGPRGAVSFDQCTVEEAVATVWPTTPGVSARACNTHPAPPAIHP